MMIDRVKVEASMIKAFKSRGQISSMCYGPYDNGHILIGTTLGDFFAFNSMNLGLICQVKVAKYPISSIVIEPTQIVMCGIEASQEVTSLTFIEQKQKYIYVELGMRKYATVILKNDNKKEKARKHSKGRDSV